MCGITGVLSFNMVGRMHLIHLEEATRRLEKRGPDVHGTWFDDHVGLGHRRLSIIDVSEESNQPFHDASGRYTLVYNGEVYNYREIRQELQSQGISFSTSSDTEVVLAAFMAYGENCLEKFNGFFSLAIYDHQKQELFLARDRFGIKPLLYYLDNDKFLFASEMKSLLAFNIPKELDQDILSLYLQLTYVPDQCALLKGVKKLQPGHFLKVSDSNCFEESYYSLSKKVDQDLSYEQSKQSLKELLRQSVERRMVSDVPLGAFLSGGIDSSTIVALASELKPDLKTFSIGFKDNKYFDETRYASLVAQKFKTDHTTFTLSNQDLLNHVEDIIDYIDEPFADSSSIPFYILSKLTRAEITVALSGDGADEVFSGYNKHRAWMMSQQPTLSNALIKNFGGIASIFPKSRGFKMGDKARQLQKYRELLKQSGSSSYWHLAKFISARSIDKLLIASGSAGEHKNLLGEFSFENLNDILFADMHLILPGDMLRKVDLMSMANGLEVRVPFLDHDVVDFAFSRPVEFKLHEGQTKRLLRDSFRDLLPEALYNRPKHGFEVPLLQWLKRDYAIELDRLVFDRNFIRDQGLFNWKEIKKIRTRLKSFNPGDSPIQAWSLYVFQRWYNKYFQG